MYKKSDLSIEAPLIIDIKHLIRRKRLILKPDMNFNCFLKDKLN